MAAYGGFRGLVIVWGFNLTVDQTLEASRLCQRLPALMARRIKASLQYQGISFPRPTR